ncbi:3-oxoacyl-[acyl-carrier-protein] reductase FabG [compost metagenome]
MSAASKGALEIAVKGIALELAPKGVTVNCVIPGAIQKDHLEDSVSDEELQEQARTIPLGRAGKPADVAAAIGFLLSPGAGYITGQALHVNGGLHI